MRCILLAGLLAIAAPLTGQERPLERYSGNYSVVESTIPAPNSEIVFTPVAGGLGIHSIWKHGSGDSYYEAHALWGQDPASKRVEVLEVNSIGVVALHVGGFDAQGTLTLQRFGEDGATVLERRRFSWVDASTLRMDLEVRDPAGSIEHVITIRRH